MPIFSGVDLDLSTICHSGAYGDPSRQTRFKNSRLRGNDMLWFVDLDK